MHLLWALNDRRWYIRLPIKAFILTLANFFVCYPYPAAFVRHVNRWRNPNALIEPNSLALQPWVDELRETLPHGASDHEIVDAVEGYVYVHVPYAWDWDNWGVSDYIPTVTELVERGKEDCDGRAVAAASLLTRLGVPARLVTDFGHVWVTTSVRDAMGPGRKQAVIATDRGLWIDWHALPVLIRATAYGIAVFPWERQAIVLAVFWILLLRRGGGFASSVLPGFGLAMGLWAMRAGGMDYWKPMSWLQPTGAALMFGSIITMLAWTSRRARIAGPFPTVT